MSEIKYPKHIKNLIKALPRGIDNAKPASYIAKLFHPEIDPRTVLAYKAIAIRDYGIPIGARRDSQNGGLFIIENDEERTSVLKVSSSQITSEVLIQNALTQIDLNSWEVIK